VGTQCDGGRLFHAGERALFGSGRAARPGRVLSDRGPADGVGPLAGGLGTRSSFMSEVSADWQHADWSFSTGEATVDGDGLLWSP